MEPVADACVGRRLPSISAQRNGTGTRLVVDRVQSLAFTLSLASRQGLGASTVMEAAASAYEAIYNNPHGGDARSLYDPHTRHGATTCTQEDQERSEPVGYYSRAFRDSHTPNGCLLTRVAPARRPGPRSAGPSERNEPPSMTERSDRSDEPRSGSGEAPLNDIEEHILGYLSAQTESGLTIGTSKIVEGTEHAKLLVNQTLYALLKKGLVRQTPGSPPLWSAAVLGRSAPVRPLRAGAEPYVVVLIDGGNVHKTLQRVLPYAEQCAMDVRFYADLAFNGYGINPKVNCKNVTIFHAKTPDKNSADVALIWDVCRLVDRLAREQPSRELQAFCVTLDLQFQSLKTLVEANPLHKFTFCTGWEALRDHIEG